jgi:hypothetical protein
LSPLLLRPLRRMRGRRDPEWLTALEEMQMKVAADLRLLGVAKPADLVGRDPYAMYDELCQVTGRRHDPCLLDTFMGGEPAKPWWAFTAERKRELKEQV